MPRFLACLLALLLPGLLVVSAARAADAPAIAVTGGAVSGAVQDGVSRYLGIPYAAPPVGPLRWQPPAPPLPWTGVRAATRFGAACAQLVNLPFFAEASTAEDCLFANVFTNARRGDKRPVMVWIHGGGLSEGQSNDYDGAKLVKLGKVVVVSFNYRLNQFGFFAHPALDAEHHALANYGLMDQQLALAWVQHNIAAFGGDPGNVTIFGESAGGVAVLAQMASPTAKGLFQRAIAQSGSYQTKQVTLKEAEDKGEKFAAAMGCADLDCLRKLPPDQILAKMRGFTNAAIVDGTILPADIKTAFASGAFNQVPLLNGSNHDEYRFFIAIAEARGKPLQAADYESALAQQFGAANVAKITAAYPLSAYQFPNEALASARGDQYMVCPLRGVNRMVAPHAPVYGFVFNDPAAPNYGTPVSFPVKAGHTLEMQYLFAGYHGATGSRHALNAEQEKLSDRMVQYWTNFARSGDPNGPGLPAWPRYDAAKANFLSLETGAIAPVADFAGEHHCDLWDSLVPL